ncbi:MAG: 2-hydroxyacyl-CoA dehydratase [Spirochaetales bacterium]|nr:2-hydroxyacyl-CoA dehydratase [Spirochaetales bacterium]
MKNEYLVGIDVGSTTVKIAVVDGSSNELLFSRYLRHNAEQAKVAKSLLDEAHREFGQADFRVAVCGSGGQTIADRIGAFFVQEVVANSVAIRTFYKDARVAIELGGQDAKVIFFHYDEATDKLMTSDMRMNGSCAGGTGAFIDQVAELLHVSPDSFSELANKGKNLYDISGRCGVFAKTDIQPLINQGVSKDDIALSTYHAIAKQTIGGLAQGMDITPKVVFEGGPLTFNPRLIEVFKERLFLKDEDVVIPHKPEIIVAWGAALSIPLMFNDQPSTYNREKAFSALNHYIDNGEKNLVNTTDLFFQNNEEAEEFFKRHKTIDFKPVEFPEGAEVSAYLGIDAGSTTSKFVLLDTEGKVIDRYYSSNMGDPLLVVRNALVSMRDKYRAKGQTLNVLGVGTTGYGELLFSEAFKADYHTVETVAHAEAARLENPDVSFILDIGGQDMKAIFIKNGIVTGIVLNEACSAGCGSFVETYARSLGIKVEDIAELAFKSEHPSLLGSRCTVFMNSSIITEQKNGKTTEDILAGICHSIIENVFTKVVRISNIKALGEKIVVQGGTFKNDAVLRAFEQYSGQKVIRPELPGEMGAIGIALLTKKHIEAKKADQGEYVSRFIGLENLEDFSYVKEPGLICTFCSNNCNRTVVTFSDGSRFITGNRCERGEIIGEVKDPVIKAKLAEATKKMKSVPDAVALHNHLLVKDYDIPEILPSKAMKIGIPRTLEFWSSLPFWKSLFQSLGFEVVVSAKSSYPLFESGLKSIPSDTVCFPGKLAHGHVQDLIDKKVDRIFMPMMVRILKEHQEAVANHTCCIVQGYPLIIDKNDEPLRRFGIPFDHPAFHWYSVRLKQRQICEFMENTFNISPRHTKVAIKIADEVQRGVMAELVQKGQAILDSLEGTNDFAVLLAGRPYHSDELVNHNLARYFTRLGIPVLTLDSLPGIHEQELSNVRIETTIPFHTRIIAAAKKVARAKNLEIVQIVSFGCGHDAVLSDEMSRILHEEGNKELLILKLDEGENTGPLNIRIKSFIQTIKAKRANSMELPVEQKREAFPLKFEKADRKKKTLLIPNLSEAFCLLSSVVLEKEGFMVKPLPLASRKAIELGKRYVHNDICYPAQINIGEALIMIESGEMDPDNVAVALAKNCEDCRAGQYATLARKALDEAGYPQIPIVTTGIDTKNMYPGFRLGLSFQLRMLWGLAMVDGLEAMRRRVRPYELVQGQTEEVYQGALNRVLSALRISYRKALAILPEIVQQFNEIQVIEQIRRPRVGIVGEILMNYHPVSNGNMEMYLEKNGMEVVFPTMVDFFRRELVAMKDKGVRKLLPHPWLNMAVADITDSVYEYAVQRVGKIFDQFRFTEPRVTVNQMVENTKDFIDISYQVGEGWLIPAEIIQMIKKGVNSVVIVQPFGCLPNHITGRGMIKSIKNRFPTAQVLSLDFDPDTSFANVENRLQMLIINAKETERLKQADYNALNRDVKTSINEQAGADKSNYLR